MSDPVEPDLTPLAVVPRRSAGDVLAAIGAVTPVRPNPSPAVNALIAIAVSAASSAAVLALALHPRDGAPWWELAPIGAAAAAAFLLAFRSAVPAASPSAPIRAAILATPALFVVLALLLAPESAPLGPPICLEVGVALALVPGAVAIALARRGFSTRPGLTGAAAGTGAALAAMAVLQLHCPLTSGQHMGVMHGGIPLVALALSALVGARILRR